ncbi:MAG: hypothetical protein K2X39_01535 [Silvanigrellaceae bacterium]|nr:hypothetical protein [Silvanigrellaceae bacterium]
MATSSAASCFSGVESDELLTEVTQLDIDWDLGGGKRLSEFCGEVECYITLESSFKKGSHK